MKAGKKFSPPKHFPIFRCVTDAIRTRHRRENRCIAISTLLYFYGRARRRYNGAFAFVVRVYLSLTAFIIGPYQKFASKEIMYFGSDKVVKVGLGF